jgi:SMC interacting uncharacterized protein involved in chromosome segregation
MPTLSSLFAEVNSLKHKRTVYEHLLNELGSLIGDNVEEANRSITTDGVGPVPSDAVKEVADRIREKMLEPLQRKIDRIEKMEIRDEEDAETNRTEEGSGAPSEEGSDEGTKQGGLASGGRPKLRARR